MGAVFAGNHRARPGAGREVTDCPSQRRCGVPSLLISCMRKGADLVHHVLVRPFQMLGESVRGLRIVCQRVDQIQSCLDEVIAGAGPRIGTSCGL